LEEGTADPGSNHKRRGGRKKMNFLGAFEKKRYRKGVAFLGRAE